MNKTSKSVSTRKSRRGIGFLTGALSLILIISIILVLNGNGSFMSQGPEMVKIVIEERPAFLLQLIANGGLTTQPDSIYDQLGISIEFVIADDYTAYSDMVISGEAAGFGTSINRYAMMQDGFADAGLDTIIPYVAARSNGTDALLASEEIKSINALAGRKIAVAAETEAQVLVEWLLVNSGLSHEEIAQIRTNMELCSTHDDAMQSYINGDADAAAVRACNISECQHARQGTHVLFDTGMSSKLVMDAFIFRTDFIEVNEDFVNNFIKGSFQAIERYEAETSYLREMPAFAELSDEELLLTAQSAIPLSWTKNAKLLTGAAPELYAEMAELWNVLGIDTDPSNPQDVFTDKYMQALSETCKGEVESDDDASKRKEIDADTLLENADIIFESSMFIEYTTNGFELLEESKPVLSRFSNVAKLLDASNVYIIVENNLSLRNFSYPGMNDQIMYELSLGRANAIKEFFIECGIEASQIVLSANSDQEALALYDSVHAKRDAVYEASGADVLTSVSEAIEEMGRIINSTYSEVEEDNEAKIEAINARKAADEAFEELMIAYDELQRASDKFEEMDALIALQRWNLEVRMALEALMNCSIRALHKDPFRQTTISFVYLGD